MSRGEWMQLEVVLERREDTANHARETRGSDGVAEDEYAIHDL
jgi:hypothetical protein